MSRFGLSYFALALALCASLPACGETARGEEPDGGTQLTFSDPTLLADKYVSLRDEFEEVFCEYFDPDGRVFGSGVKTTEAGTFELNGYGRWDVFQDRACLNYEGSSRCTHVIILPVFIPHDHRFRILLLDDDVGGVADDEVGVLVRVPADIAEGLDDYSGTQTFTFPDDDDRGVTFQIIGRWHI